MSATERVAYAVTRGDDPKVFLAEDEFVLTRVIALQLVAATPAEQLAASDCAEIRAALLDERWADAVFSWIEATDTPIDVFPPELIIWTHGLLDTERTSLESRLAPIFNAPDDR